MYKDIDIYQTNKIIRASSLLGSFELVSKSVLVQLELMKKYFDSNHPLFQLAQKQINSYNKQEGVCYYSKGEIHFNPAKLDGLLKLFTKTIDNIKKSN